MASLNLPSSISRSSDLCQEILTPRISAIPITGSLTMHNLALVICGVCFGVTALLAIGLILTHVKYYSNRHEQRQIIRLNLVPATYTLFALISAAAKTKAGFIGAVAKIFESIAFVCLFLLVLEYAFPNSLENPAVTIAGLKSLARSRSSPTAWYKRDWILIWQYPIVTFATFLATEALEATICPVSKDFRRDLTVIRVFSTISVLVIILGLILFYHRVKHLIGNRRVISKLFVFKSMVGVVTLDLFVFAIITTALFKEVSQKVTFYDWVVSVPAILISGQMVLFQLAFLWAFSAKPYKELWKSGRASNGFGGFGRRMLEAFVDVIDVRDIVRGMFLICRSGRYDAPMKNGDRMNLEASERLGGINNGSSAV